MRRPSTSRTSTLPSRSRATVTVLRSKKPASRMSPDGTASGTASDSDFAHPLAAHLSPALVHVKGLVGHLIHRLPVHARPPRGDPDAELHGHRHLFRAVQLVERLPHPGAHLAGIALIGLRHGDPELVAAEAATGVGRTHGPL